MKKIFYFFPLLFSLSAIPAQAICPVCVVAVSAGLGLSEYLGIDDTIAGLWIGGLLVSMIIWTIDWLNKKGYRFGNSDWRDILVVILYYGLTFWPLWAQNLIGQPTNRLWGVDKLILGTALGSLVFLGAVIWYKKIKTRLGHAQFPFQKVAMPVAALIISSFIFYFLTK
ncbi:MAG: hypothetical protein WC863_00970 [Patescibacteria group bacterium]